MSEPEQSSSRDLADTASSLAGLGDGSLPGQASDSPAAALAPAGEHVADGEPAGSEPPTPPRPSSTSSTQRGLPAVQPALASLLPPVAPQLHLGRLGAERSPSRESPAEAPGAAQAVVPGQRSDSGYAAADAAADAASDTSDADDDRPTNFPPRPDNGEPSAADGEASEGAEPYRSPIVPPVAAVTPERAPQPLVSAPAEAAPGEPSLRTGSRPKPLPAPPGFPPFAQALWAAGLIAELRAESLGALPRLDDPPDPRQRLDFLEAYYAAGTDPVVSLRRRATDRWFVYDATQPLLGPQLVQRLTFVLPELAQAHLERVGGKHGTLLLRAGEHVCALDDDQADRQTPSIAVSEIVRGMNMLMERRGERVRLVGLVGDGAREAYVGLHSLTLALALAGKELLTARDTETLMHLTGW